MKGLLIVCDVCECREPCSDTTDEAMPPGWRRAWSRSRLTRDNQRYPELVDIYGRKPLTRLTLCPLCQSGAPMSEAVKSLVAAALAALDAVVLEEMKADDAGKYQRITRILKNAADLKALYARSMKDVLGGVDEEDAEEGLGLYNVGGRPRLYGGGDQVDMQREMMMLVQKQVDAQIEANKPKPKDPVRALEDLMALSKSYRDLDGGLPAWLQRATLDAEKAAEASLSSPGHTDLMVTPESLLQTGRTDMEGKGRKVVGTEAFGYRDVPGADGKCPPPPLGYAPCTRGAPHEGPCAMPLDHAFVPPNAETAREVGDLCIHYPKGTAQGFCALPERLHPTRAVALAGAAIARADDADRSAKGPRNDIFDGAVHEG